MPRILAEAFTIPPASIEITPEVSDAFQIVTDKAEIQAAVDVCLPASV
jgi:hypothetical protein